MTKTKQIILSIFTPTMLLIAAYYYCFKVLVYEELKTWPIITPSVIELEVASATLYFGILAMFIVGIGGVIFYTVTEPD